MDQEGPRICYMDALPPSKTQNFIWKPGVLNTFYSQFSSYLTLPNILTQLTKTRKQKEYNSKHYLVIFIQQST